MKPLALLIISLKKEFTTDNTEKHRLNRSVKICEICVKTIVFVFFSFAFCLGASGQFADNYINQETAKKNKVKTVTEIVTSYNSDTKRDTTYSSAKHYYDKSGKVEKTVFLSTDTADNITYYKRYDANDRLVVDSTLDNTDARCQIIKYEYDSAGNFKSEMIVFEKDTIMYLYKYKNDTVFWRDKRENIIPMNRRQYWLVNKNGDIAKVFNGITKEKVYLSEKYQYDKNNNVVKGIGYYNTKQVMWTFVVRRSNNGLSISNEMEQKGSNTGVVTTNYSYEFYD